MTVATRTMPRPRPPSDEAKQLAAARESYALVERIQAGDREAFAVIYQQHYMTVFKFAYYKVGNKQLGEDIAQEVFVRALRRIGQFQWESKPVVAWLITIARNLVADYFKSGRFRLEMLSENAPVLAVSEPTSTDPAPEDGTLAYLANRDLLTVLLELTEDQQEVLILRFFRGLSVAETAKAMGKNEGATKALQYRAARSMARILGPGWNADE